MVTFVVIWLIAGANTAMIILNVRSKRRMDAQWAEAQRLADVAALQAKVLGDARDLICDDCRRIVHGVYMRDAYSTVQAALDEEA